MTLKEFLANADPNVWVDVSIHKGRNAEELTNKQLGDLEVIFWTIEKGSRMSITVRLGD